MRERGSGWALPGATFPLQPERSALVIVDMQYAMAAEGHGIVAGAERASPGSGGYYFERVRDVTIPALQRLLAFFRSRGLRVIHVHYASREPDGSDLLPLMRQRNAARLAQVGTLSIYPVDHPEAQPIPELAPLSGERVLVKASASAFSSTAIDQLLRNWGIESVLVGGVLTSGCVDLTARDAADKGYNTVLVEDACAGWKEITHQTTLGVFASMFGRVATSDAVLAELGSPAATAPRGSR